MEKQVYRIINPDQFFLLKQRADWQTRVFKNNGGSLDNCITPYQLREMIDKGVIVFPKGTDVQENDVIIASEGNLYNVWKEINTINDILYHRMTTIKHIVYLLGGKHFKGVNTFEIKSSEDSKGEYNLEVKGIGNSSAEIEEEKQEVFSAKVVKEMDASGVLNKESYAKAIKYAEQNNLLKREGRDTDIALLIEQRNPNNPNVLTREKHSIELAYDLVEKSNLAFKLQGGIDSLFHLNTNVNANKSICKSASFRFEFEAEFGPIKQL